MMEVDTAKYPVILFDGICNYCNHAVLFSIKWNKKKNLRYATLQSEYAQALLSKNQLYSYPDSIIFIESGKIFFFSTAVCKIAKHLGFPVSALSFMLYIPAFMRDPLYKWIAKNRYRWFGKRESCMIPDTEMKKLFLS